jgi:hypothetical protein
LVERLSPKKVKRRHGAPVKTRFPECASRKTDTNCRASTTFFNESFAAFEDFSRALYNPAMPKMTTFESAPERKHHFASDNYSGICLEALASMLEANQRHEVGYGDDSWTEKASSKRRAYFTVSW